jgi:hypothetical protein
MRYVPHGVMPPAQLLRVPTTRVPVGSAVVFIRSCPAAGPDNRIRVSSAVMRRAYRLSGTTVHVPAAFRRISMTEAPWAAISTSTSSRVTREKSSCLAVGSPTPGNMISLFVYS